MAIRTSGKLSDRLVAIAPSSDFCVESRSRNHKGDFLCKRSRSLFDHVPNTGWSTGRHSSRDDPLELIPKSFRGRPDKFAKGRRKMTLAREAGPQCDVSNRQICI
jgi:hypothetical protein